MIKLLIKIIDNSLKEKGCQKNLSMRWRGVSAYIVRPKWLLTELND